MWGGGEVLTVQLGPASNFVGAHFWNAQDEQLHLDGDAFGASEEGYGEEDHVGDDAAGSRQVRHQVLYRSGTKFAVPRVVAFDFLHSVGTLQPTRQWMDSSMSSLFALDNEQLIAQAGASWQGGVEVHRQPEAIKNDFLKWLDGEDASAKKPAKVPDKYGNDDTSAKVIEDVDLYRQRRVKDQDVQVWSDFLKAQMHHKSLNLMHRHGDTDFTSFVAGKDLIGSGSGVEEFEAAMDSVRYFVEECDRLEGLHCIVDIDSGFGSLGQHLIQEFRDDVKSNVSVLTMGVVGPISRWQQRQQLEEKTSRTLETRRKVNEAVAMYSFSSSGLHSLYVPLPLYNMSRANLGPLISSSFDANSMFHTTALAAVGLDCLSLPYRTRNPRHGPHSVDGLRELCGRLAPQEDCRVANLSLKFPFPHPVISTGQLSEMFTSWNPLHSTAAPISLHLSTCKPLEPKSGDCFTTFGSSLVARGLHSSEQTDRNLTAQSVDDIVKQLSMRTRVRLSPCPVYSTCATPFPITLAFPDILRNELLGTRGELLNTASSEAFCVPPLSVPVLSHLETSTRSGGDVLAAKMSLVNASTISKFELSKGHGGICSEDLKEMVSFMDAMTEVYCEGLHVPEETQKHFLPDELYD